MSMTRHESLALKALAEAGLPYQTTDVDLASCSIECADRHWNILFPKMFVQQIGAIRRETPKGVYVFYFRGRSSHPQRDWVNTFKDPLNYIELFEADRSNLTLDRDYFTGMCKSLYALCPRGDYRWSYRFFEACLCGTLPVITHEEICNQYEGYEYLLTDSSYLEKPVDFSKTDYYKSMVTKNYRNIIEECTI